MNRNRQLLYPTLEEALSQPGPKYFLDSNAERVVVLFIFPRLLQAGWANFQNQSSDRVVLLVNSFFKILLQINGKQF